MTDSKISGLPTANTLTGTELVPVVQGGSTVQTTIALIAAKASSTAATVTLNGDVNGTGSGTIQTSLAASGATAGNYTNANITINSKGLITAASNGATVITGLLTAGTNITLTGTGTASNPYVINSTASGGGGISAITGDGTAGSNGVLTVTKINGVTAGLLATQNTVNLATQVTGILPVANSFSKGTLTDTATITWDLNVATAASITLGGNRALSNPTNIVDGGTYTLIVTQDSTGSRTLSYGTSYKWAGGSPPVLSTAAGAVDVLTFIANGSNMLGVASKAFA